MGEKIPKAGAAVIRKPKGPPPAVPKNVPGKLGKKGKRK